MATGPTISCGGFEPCRLLMVIAVELVVVTAKLTRPSPETSEETSKLIHCPAWTLPLSTTAPTAGAFALVRLVSPQVLPATPLIWTPVELELCANSRSVAGVAPPTPCTSKRRYAVRTGEASVRSVVAVP